MFLLRQNVLRSLPPRLCEVIIGGSLFVPCQHALRKTSRLCQQRQKSNGLDAIHRARPKDASARAASAYKCHRSSLRRSLPQRPKLATHQPRISRNLPRNRSRRPQEKLESLNKKGFPLTLGKFGTPFPSSPSRRLSARDLRILRGYRHRLRQAIPQAGAHRAPTPRAVQRRRALRQDGPQHQGWPLRWPRPRQFLSEPLHRADAGPHHLALPDHRRAAVAAFKK